MEPANKSHAKLEEKTSMIRQEFNLPASLERVIQDYRCSWNGVSGGKMFITQDNVFFWRSSKPNEQHKLPFRLVASVKPVQKTLVVGTVDGQEHVYASFTSVGKRDEACALMQHFFGNPFSLLEVRPEEEDGAWSPGAPRSGAAAMVDLESGESALRHAARAERLGQATMEELARQKEVVGKMDESLARMDVDLAMADRHLRGIESIGGALANKMTDGKTLHVKGMGGGVRGSRLLGHRGSMAGVEAIAKHPDVEYDCVYKHPNDALELSKASFTAQGFVLHGTRYPYDAIDAVTMRARPFHCDIALRGGERTRLASAHLQLIVNELFLRCSSSARPLPVQFERNAIQFTYGSTGLRVQERQDRYDYLSPDVRRAVKEQDKQLDQIGVAAKRLQGMALDIGQEADDSMKDLKNLKRHVDDVGMKVSVSNARVENLL